MRLFQAILQFTLEKTTFARISFGRSVFCFKKYYFYKKILIVIFIEWIMDKIKIILFVCCCVFLSNCNQKPGEQGGLFPFSKTMLEKNYPDFNEEILKDSLKTLFSDSSRISNLYKENAHLPIWTRDIYHESLDTLLYYLENSYKHGLNPEKFNYSKLKILTAISRTGLFKNDMADFYKKMMHIEEMATQAFLSYNTGLRLGFSNPRKLFSGDYHITVHTADSSFLATLHEGLKTNPIDFLAASQPIEKDYKKLQDELLFYHAYKDSVFTPIPKKGEKAYKLNEESPVFPLVSKRLMLTGELPKTDYPDSIYASLTPDLLAAINKFRKKISFLEDEEVGNMTIDALNRPIKYYYEKLQANLERARWKRIKDVGDKYVEVNVAAFLLKAIEPNAKPLVMKVCVGKAGDNQTPLLESDITYVNLNPQWNVPASIAEKEIYWSVKKKPDYLARNRMKLIDKKTGKEVETATLNWDELNPKQLPFRIQQASGSGNSLGRIKFMFNNRFSVYLHDTPTKSAFARKNRAVSHGCVRVEKPVDLAHFCFEEKDDIFLDRLLLSIDEKPRSDAGLEMQRNGKLRRLDDIVNLPRQIPVSLNYYTAFAMPDEQVYFADDVYDFDKRILNAIK